MAIVRPDQGSGGGSGTPSPNDLRVIGFGLLSETYPLAAVANQTQPATQRLEGGLLGLAAGTSVTGVAVAVQANSATLTLLRAALYSTAGTLLASSANVPTALDAAAGTVATIAFSAPFSVVTSGAYYACLLGVGTTRPTLYRSTTFGIVSPGAGASLWVAQTGQADLPSPAGFFGESVAYWFGAF